MVEIMIVVGIILILATIAIPNMLRSKITANETGAVAACRSIYNAISLYATKQETFPTSLSYLVPPQSNPGYVDPALAQATSSETAAGGYYYVYTQDATQGTFSINAIPKNAITGKKHFYINQNGAIHYVEGRDATEQDPTY